jgi:hypothetical protein
MGVSLKPEHLKRYKDFAWLLWKYGRGDLVRHAGLSDLMPEVEQDEDGAPPAEAEQLAADVESLGPTCIKLGQLLSTRPDIIPQAYARARLARLQDDVTPFPFAELEKIVADELGVRPLEGFSFHRREAARGRLDRAGAPREAPRGREVALKVQRPGIRERVPTTWRRCRRWCASLTGTPSSGAASSSGQMFDQFRKSLARELDFRQEAVHLMAPGAQPRRDRGDLRPEPVLGYSSSRVLAMEFIGGAKNHVAQPARAHRARRRAPRRRALPRVSPADAARRPVPRRSASGQRVRGEREDRAHRPRHGGAPLAWIAGPAAAAPARGGGQPRRDDAAKTLLLLGERRENADQAAFTRGVTDIVAQHQEVRSAAVRRSGARC